MRGLPFLALALALLFAAPAHGKVVDENTDDLPPGCDAIAGEESVTIRGGRKHAEDFPGAVFSFDQRNLEFPPCTRVTVTFVNDDDIRHQFMVHGAWPTGLFLIEVDGPGSDTGTFITDATPKTRLYHCGVPQHQQKGMKGQVLVDGGKGNLPNILGVSGLPPEDGGPPLPRSQDRENDTPLPVAAAALALVGAGLALRRRR